MNSIDVIENFVNRSKDNPSRTLGPNAPSYTTVTR